MNKKRYYCASCDDIVDGSCGHIGLTKIQNKKEQEMTREEAIAKMNKLQFNRITADQFIGCLEALRLLKFEEEKKKVRELFKITASNIYWPAAALYQPDTKDLKVFNDKYGVIRLEEWPEGLVLWVDGEIVYKSWEKVYRAGDTIQLYDGCGGYVSGRIKSPGC